MRKIHRIEKYHQERGQPGEKEGQFPPPRRQKRVSAQENYLLSAKEP